MIKFNVNINFDVNKVGGNVNQAIKKAQVALDEQVLKDSNYFIPKDEGYLEESGVTYSQIGEGLVIWNTPYARRLYYNPQYNFSKDQNPNASGLWFEIAKLRWGSDWRKLAQSTFDDNY